MKRIYLFICVLTMAFSLCACQSKTSDTDSVDQQALEKIEGGYSFVGNCWILEIVKDWENPEGKRVPYFSIYDAEAGNPGVEGAIKKLDGKQIVVDVEEDYFDGLPADEWQLEKDRTLAVTYKKEDGKMTLTNQGKEVTFEQWKEEE